MPQNPRRQLAQNQPGIPRQNIVRFQHRAVLVEAGELARKFKQIIAQKIRTIFLGDRFKLYVSDGRFAGPPIFLSAEDLGVLFNYSVSCLEAVRGANDE